MLNLVALSDAEIRALSDAIVAVTRELAQSVPAPKGAPYYGLDLAVTDPATLDSFSQHGIFRKYERALALGGGLGGVLRWWAVRFGCTVLGIEERASMSGAAARLSARAGLDTQTGFAAGVATALPLRSGAFTHVWGLEALAAGADSEAVLREMFRVLRPGGACALYLSSERQRDHSLWIERLGAAGFVTPTLRTLPPARPPQFIVLARRRLRAHLELERHAPTLAAMVADIDQPSPVSGAAALLFGQRPS